MPELPEVETIRLSLLPHLLDQRLKDIQVNETRLRQPLKEDELRRWLIGHQLKEIQRRGRYLLFLWDNQSVLLIHLGMGGRLGYYQQRVDAEPHTHVIFYFEDGAELHFRDPRRFGSICVFPMGGLDQCEPLQHLGVEPLSRFFRSSYLWRHLSRTKRPIKNVIMDNSVVVGVGNIYANEALFGAGIHPQRAACTLNRDEADRVRRSIVAVLRKALRSGGTTLRDFRNAHGEPGFFQVELAVYGREGQACPVCFTPISRLMMGGRSSFVCTKCQR